MRKKAIQKFKEHLEDERRILVSQNQQKLKDYLGHTIDENRDSADLANEEYENALKASSNNHQLLHLIEIDRALDKIEDGSYGLCDECTSEINIERLEAIPNASLCISCQENYEKEGLVDNGEVSTLGFSLPPFGSRLGRKK